MTERSMGNVIRDLVYFGLAERQGETVTSAHTPAGGLRGAIPLGTITEHLIEPMFSILRAHVFVAALAKTATESDHLFDEDGLEMALRSALPTVVYRDQTWRAYALRLAKYLGAVGILQRRGIRWALADDPRPQFHFPFSIMGRRQGLFLADAPPDRALHLLGRLSEENLSMAQIQQEGLRNARYVLIALGLAVNISGTVSIGPDLIGENLTEGVRDALSEMETFQTALEFIRQNPLASGAEVGEELAEQQGFDWSFNSKMRNGNAMKRWVTWYEQTQDDGVEAN